MSKNAAFFIFKVTMTDISNWTLALRLSGSNLLNCWINCVIVTKEPQQKNSSMWCTIGYQNAVVSNASYIIIYWQ